MSNLESFFDRIASTHPFTDNRVTGTSAADVDVNAIHARAFEQLLALAREARDERRGLGAVLWGEAGIGKSHLLARLSRWSQQDKNACLVYLHNLQASPENLPRSLLRSTVAILTRGREDEFAETPLYRLVNAFVREALQAIPSATYSCSHAQRAFGKLVDQLNTEDPSRAALVDRTVYRVLYRFFESANLARTGSGDESVARLAVRWLAGDFLDPAEARQLDLRAAGPDRPVALADNQQIKQVLVAVARMALSRKQPLVLCFDQMDNLDTDQAAALARFLQALLDSASNLLVIVAGIQASLLQWRGAKVIQDSAWDRLGQFEIPLQRISVPEGRALVTARLRHLLEPFADLDEVKQQVQEDPLFPLGQVWSLEFLKDRIEVRPRDVVTWAREGWRREQEALRQLGGPRWLAGWGVRRPEDGIGKQPTTEQLHTAIDQKVAQKFAEVISQRQAEPHTLPPDADNLAGLVYALVWQYGQGGAADAALDIERVAAPAHGPRPTYDMLVRHHQPGLDKELRTGLLFLTTSNATTATTALRKLLRDEEAPERVFLVTDAREPLPLAAKGKEYRQHLSQRDGHAFQSIELTFEQYAELDALQAVVGLARSGDLEIELPGGTTRPVTDQEVMESHRRQGRYQNAAVLKDLLVEIPAAQGAPMPGVAREQSTV
jgi:hypothetical protein